MRAIFGLLQLGCLVASVLALIKGEWLIAAGAFAGAGVSGLIGNQAVRKAEGVSETGREGIGKVGEAIELLRAGRFQAASGVTRSAVSDFRLGGDRLLLPIALTVHAVALASVRDVDGSQTAIDEATRAFRTVPPELQADSEVFLEVLELAQREVGNGVPDPTGFVADFLALNDAP